MAYNKSKHVESAQKFLHQGKVTQAIAEYLAILKHEPKDQVTLMTIGDLYVRQGETFQALEYFERLAKIFLNDGFVAKAIAIYKKIAKLAPEETRPVERLAELYVQQGVLSEARPIYLQLAELHERAGRQAQAAQLLRKLLDAEPDNLRVQTRLATLWAAIGQPAEAAAGYFTAAEQLHRRGDNAEAVKYADLALGIRPNDVPASTLKARALAAAGRRPDAELLLEALPDLETGGDAAELLLDFYLEGGQIERASEFVTKIFARNRKRFAAAHRVAAMVLETEDPGPALVLIDLVRGSMTDAGEHEVLSQLLIRATERLPERIEPREWLVELYGRASDSFRLPDALAKLAESYEAAGQHDRARQTYEQLLEQNPENEGVRRKYNKLQKMTGGHAAVEEVPCAPAPQTLANAGASVAATDAEPALDAETQLFVSQSLTDVDLFSSYGLTQKAIDLLEVVLLRAPQHTPTLERLLDLSLGAGDERRIAELASRLEQIHSERGHAAPADRFAELRRRFERAAGRAAAEPTPASASVAQAPEFSVAPPEIPFESPLGVPAETAALASDAAIVDGSHPMEGSPSGEDWLGQVGLSSAGTSEIASEPDVHEIDLSEEWAALAGELGVTFPLRSADQGAAEFELTFVPPETVPDKSAPVESVEPESVPVDTIPVLGTSDGVMESEPETAAAPVLAEERASVDELLDGDAAVGTETNRATAERSGVEASGEEAGRVAPEQVLEPAIPGNVLALAGDNFLMSLADELDIVPAPAQFSAPNVAPAASNGDRNDQPIGELAQPLVGQSAEHFADQADQDGPLGEVFDEFRADMGDGLEDEDPETHYNLGTAYREMGLTEESISEFQKVAQMVERQAQMAKSGRNGSKTKQKHGAFRYAMQCCTLLGLAFMEKGESSIAAMWYARALETPGLDQDSILALRYDLGVAQELAGDTAAARKSLSQVYGMNIDYRDVAERLAALGKGH